MFYDAAQSDTGHADHDSECLHQPLKYDYGDECEDDDHDYDDETSTSMTMSTTMLYLRRRLGLAQEMSRWKMAMLSLNMGLAKPLFGQKDQQDSEIICARLKKLDRITNMILYDFLKIVIDFLKIFIDFR